MVKLKIKNNLFLVGDRVISYNTEVARIKGDKIIANGTYSRTTGKHLSHLSGIAGMEVIRNTKRKVFYQFGYGVRCEVDGAVSDKGSQLILSRAKELGGLEVAAASSFGELNRNDRAKVSTALNRKGYSDARIKELSEGYRFLKEIGLICPDCQD